MRYRFDELDAVHHEPNDGELQELFGCVSIGVQTIACTVPEVLLVSKELRQHDLGGFNHALVVTCREVVVLHKSKDWR